MDNRNENPAIYFVRNITKNRDNSHGLDHMMKVMRNSMMIFKKSEHCENIKIGKLVFYSAILHDVYDHKYDIDGSLRKATIDFLNQHTDFTNSVMRIIDCISFSKEKRLGKRYFETLLNNQELIARDIVSDGDKIEALGSIGYERCKEYSFHYLTKKLGYEPCAKTVNDEVKKHYQEKLAILADEYIVTDTGKIIAKYQNDILKNLIYK